MKRLRKILSIMLVSLLVFSPLPAKGESPSARGADVKVLKKSAATDSRPLKNPSNLQSTFDYHDPAEYPLVSKGQKIATLTDSYGTNHTFTLKDIRESEYDSDSIDLIVGYASDFAYTKESNVYFEFFYDIGGYLEYIGRTSFNTVGYTNVNLISTIPNDYYTDQEYIYIRLGIVNEANPGYYSAVTTFKVENPLNAGISDDYVVISNESVDEWDFQYTGSFDFRMDNSKITIDKNLNPGAYRMDAVLPYDPKKNNSKPLNKSTNRITRSYQVGDKKDFWVTDLVTYEDYQIEAELLYSGTKANVWVHNNQITKTQAEQLGKEFDQKIYSAVVNHFGKESDVDGDGKINILCFDIQDGFAGYGGYVAGYFYGRDLHNDPYSNRSEIFYIDTYPTMGMSGTKDVTKAYSTLAHEFQHMVNYNQNVLIEGNYLGMDTWLNEALSMAAEQIYLGKVLSDRIDYYNVSESIREGHSLLFWDSYGDVLANYSLSYLFGQYIKLQTGQGNAIFKEIIQDPNEDYRAVENAIKKYIDPSLTFGKMMTNFRVALLKKEPTGLYGFKGNPGFERIEPRIYTGGPTYLFGGGAIVKKINMDNFTEPADKGGQVTYTYVRGDEISIPKVSLSVDEVSDQDTVVKGTTVSGAKVYVKKDYNLIGQGTAGSGGNFMVSIPKQKAGTVLTVYAEDAAGNKSEEVKVTVVDKTPPAKPTVNPVADNATQVTGKTEVDATVYVKADSKQIGTGKANSNGDFTVTIPKQKAGTVLTVYAEDAAGNKSEEVKVTVADKTPPAKPMVNPVADNATQVTGKTEADATVYVKADSKQIGTGKANSNGDFTVSIPKQKAGTVLTVYAEDAAGNRSEEVKVTVADKTPPAKPTVYTVADYSTKVTGKTEAGATVYVKAGSKQIGKGTANSKGDFSVSIPKQKAGTVLTVYAVDKAGNKGVEAKVTVADKTPPAQPKVNTVGDNATKVTGKTEAYATVYVKAGSKQIGKGTANSKGDFSIKISKQKAGTTLTVYAVDKAGNKSKETKVKVVDKTPPPAPSVNKVTSKSKKVTGKAEKGATIRIYRGSKLIGKGTVSAKGTFSVSIPAQKKGTVLKVYAIDKAGNRSSARTVRVY
ncbi:Ig-like domain-containing protein [Aeribacillus composti]|uniref:Ig-like domain-containing protein n=1 Tax=Aeribacillus composti TaxID=1868734 RepID=UPI002E1AB728|nr:Ig-like domain-containing protein [Aeribacillus composti]